MQKIDIYATIATNFTDWFDSNWIYVVTSSGFVLFALTLSLWWFIELIISLDETDANL